MEKKMSLSSVKIKQSSYQTTTLDIVKIILDDTSFNINALTAIQASQDGDLFIGATNHQSEDPVLLRVDLKENTVSDTGLRFPPKGPKGSRQYSIGDKIHSALVWGTGKWEGWLLAGHGSHIWWDDGGWIFDNRFFDGGHIYAFHPGTGECIDLGLPVFNNTVHGLSGNETMLAGYSLPDNHLFIYDIAKGTHRDLGRISAYCCHNLICRQNKVFGVYRKALGEQRGDMVLAADKAAFLFVYHHDTGLMERTDILISELETNIRFNSGIDSWISMDNWVYGGRVNGSLFRFDPDTRLVEELGYPVAPIKGTMTTEQVRKLGGKGCAGINGNERVTGMTALDKDLIAGVAGFPCMHVFTFDARVVSMVDYGPVNDTDSMCYFHSVCLARMPDGRRGLACIETDSMRPVLYLCFPRTRSF
ncbi:MAG: hypothetical protein A2268_00530 [Candidatus Raymondbacteria bacterium RifOxyA12_full_50_37]|uniref:Uncharacterized protein n=1 Tax=Candidatus Raymondbacteria bacterium RIFOXYD12_FULL_49_13 TaxID=1817890 RepID=A0A1F7F2W3_UNCRA|nr:MAG: hypothetical protein A2350_09015 [Candidatus Raymondbacteria bacterium RifOxyB12_full_50_8]OGJ91469.1 MAG: hypothetical protein A2268_00530 [Candidatus Raymondbacteria bacterium RifOxyA12_full_50_37]OGJ92799.1 MAG: hypothetical protein A2248_04580 [Candidatus Raymondbacteria bacterium RIFOXYA2_FULL_49_16]OGJ96680.1 MAG: hypothetical protein A2487_09420 [Candidatus Raymondbacteria bacterium RifOxyC12_full_50_8]OGK00999.1 MAG: hypothetical protein A2519_17245 [Candidatus Raymondbacteria b